MLLSESALKVVVGKKNKCPVKYPDTADFRNGVLHGQDEEIDKTLSTPLPDVNDCVEMIADELSKAIKKTELWTMADSEGHKKIVDMEEYFDAPVCDEIAKTILANSKSILKWREV